MGIGEYVPSVDFDELVGNHLACVQSNISFKTSLLESIKIPTYLVPIDGLIFRPNSPAP